VLDVNKEQFREIMKAITLITMVSLLTGCASTTIKADGSRLKEPLCTSTRGPNTVSVIWGPKWRIDQKEPPLREAAALKGIEMFLDVQSCPKSTKIHRISVADNYQSLTDAEIISMATNLHDEADKIVVLVVRELGPKLIIGIPNLVEGGTEVVVESRVVDRRAGVTISNIKTHWQKGGPFYIKGVKSLDQDMRTTLGAAFEPMPNDSLHEARKVNFCGNRGALAASSRMGNG
jgi:hypothetical protein